MNSKFEVHKKQCVIFLEYLLKFHTLGVNIFFGLSHNDIVYHSIEPGLCLL